MALFCLLSQAAPLPKGQQEHLLSQTLTEWMGEDHAQVDDITVVGFLL